MMETRATWGHLSHARPSRATAGRRRVRRPRVRAPRQEEEEYEEGIKRAFVSGKCNHAWSAEKDGRGRFEIGGENPERFNIEQELYDSIHWSEYYKRDSPARSFLNKKQRRGRGRKARPPSDWHGFRFFFRKRARRRTKASCRCLYVFKTFDKVVDVIYEKVKHAEPWSTQGNATRGLRPVPSSAFCLLLKLFSLRLSEQQVKVP